MCIVLLTTAHPDYALIVADNRDEYLLRPTSRPGWWTHPTSGVEVLSARDLQRAEKGTWFGITRTGTLAVLTNYRELDAHDAEHPVCGVQSRGRVVTAWLGGLADDGVHEGVHRLVHGVGVAGVGGFSMVAGRLRRRDGAMAVVSNRARQAGDAAVIGQQRGRTWGLSNTVFDDPDEWPKVRAGKRLLDEAVAAAVGRGASQQELVDGLWAVLDTDTMPSRAPDMGLDAYVSLLKHSIFVPAMGDAAHREAMREARARGRHGWLAPPPGPQGEARHASEETRAEGVYAGEARAVVASASAVKAHAGEAHADKPRTVEAHAVEPRTVEEPPLETGMYGTQRQTVLLVDWAGNVTFVERALWDANGNEVPRGQGDVVFRFAIEGWDE